MNKIFTYIKYNKKLIINLLLFMVVIIILSVISYSLEVDGYTHRITAAARCLRIVLGYVGNL